MPVGSLRRTAVQRTGVAPARCCSRPKVAPWASYLRVGRPSKGAAVLVRRGGSGRGAPQTVTEGEGIVPHAFRKGRRRAERSPRSRGNNRGLRVDGRLLMTAH
ncbi:hypothetical protein SBD_7352 [Streptomyces bottropensis ATCC 25435]|uniref:Uncharacterized protein n=1 Tax=Streptomyces bottropensis ATCC 25435 TaxID=1054862 RepID=M3D607_9ACTN|nr:hypothetical protein SBD_7352 [Streptomyces bottropensis ATCC 25435]